MLLENIVFPEPVIDVAVEPKTKADQDKLATALASPVRGGSDLPGSQRRGDRPDRHLRHGRAAPRDHRRPAHPRVRRRRDRRQAAGRLPRDRAEAGREGRGQVRPPDGRPRPVRPRGHLARAEQAGLRIRVREQDRRRGHPARVHLLCRPGHPGSDERRRPRRLPRGRHQRRADLRQLPRRRLVGDGVQDRRLDGVQERDAEGRPGAARAGVRRSR